MGKKTSEKMAREIIKTPTYRIDGKIVVIDPQGNRKVFTDVIGLKGLFFGGIEVKMESGVEMLDYGSDYEINGLSCKD